MSFAYPFVLWLWVPATLFAWYFRTRRIVFVADMAVIFLLIAALARPVLFHTPQTKAAKGQTVIFALDVSRSMFAQDITPDRYRYAKALIGAFVAQDSNDAVGLIAFTTNPLLLAPPTTDRLLVVRALEALKPTDILTKGTSLRTLFEFLDTLEDDTFTVILLTDGGEERNAEALAHMLPADTKLLIVPLATPAGAPVPDRDDKALKDKQGNLVVSRRNPMLERLASLADAGWIEPAASPETTAKRLYHALPSSQEHLIKHQSISETSLAWLFLLPALLLLFAAHTRYVRLLLAAAAFAHLPLEAGVYESWHLQQAYNAYANGDFNTSLHRLNKVHTPSLQRAYLHAALLYKQGKYAKAARAFLAVKSTSSRLKQRLLYNAATAYAKAGRYDTAKRLYARVLQLGDDADARHNLAVIALKYPANAPAGRTKPSGAQSGENASGEKSDDTRQGRHATSSQQNGSKGGSGRAMKSTNAHRTPPPAPSRPMPLSSKVYDLINKGYIRETKPW